MYTPCVVIVARGRKRGFLGGKVFTYDPDHYLLMSLPLPFECQTDVAPDGPMLAMKVRIDLAVLGELLMKAGPRPIDPAAAERAIWSTPVDPPLADAAIRLAECLNKTADTQVLGPAIMREITWRVLCEPRGDCLRALAAMHGRLAQVNRTLQRIHTHYAEVFDVKTLAEEAAMSLSAFHEHFRAATSTSPLQYLKTVRLHKARMLMAHDGLGAAEAALKVGYQSPSQFSREFKRLFAAPPAAEAQRLRQMLGLDRSTGVAAMREAPSADL
jgi:AraC-like DNA-binding protein